MIGERTAEQVKMEIGSAYKLEGEEEMLNGDKRQGYDNRPSKDSRNF